MTLTLPRLARSLALGVAAAYGILLAILGVTGKWIVDAQGAPLIVDFLPVYAAGRLAAQGRAVLAYDWRGFHQVQAAFVGHDFAGYLGWHYPPLFFLVALLLATWSYTVAFLLWVAATVMAFAATLARVAGIRAALAGLALPRALACAMVGQNGFFTATLFAGFLLALPARPILAGLLIALLAYKPQLGLLVPVALIAGGYWRALLAATVGVALWVGASLVLTPELMAGFLHTLPDTSHAILSEGTAGWFKLQSIYGAARYLGGSDALAWTAQIISILGMAVLTGWSWHSKRDFNLKAALLTAAVPLATPYIYFYDLPLLAVPLAFLWRQRDFDRTEQGLLTAVVLCLLLYVVASWPLGIGASILILAMAVRRALRS